MTGRKLLSLLVLLVLGGLLIGACAAPTPTAAPQQAAQPTAAAQQAQPTVAPQQAAQPTAAPQQAAQPTAAPQQAAATKEGCGKDIVIGINGDGQTANPLYGSDSSTIFRTDQISEPLVFLDWKTLQPIPWLAESWDVSADGKTYTFHLRTGPKWPDGQPLTAQDFEFTLDTILSKDYTGPWQGLFADIVGADKYAAGTAQQVDGIKVIDDKTFSLTLNTPNAAFLALAARNLKPVPKHLLEGQKLTPDNPFMNNPIGVGPYRLVEHVKGDHLTMAAKPDYWGEPVCAKTITERIIPDMNSLGAALESGDVDQMNPLEPRYVLQFKKNPDITVYNPPARSMDEVYFNFGNEILAKQQVRQAIAMALDVNEFAKTVLSGVQPPVFGPVLSGSWAYDSAIKAPAPDLAKAKTLLAEAGYPNGFTMSVKTNAGNTTREQMATYLQAQLAKLGIKVNVQLEEWSTFFSEVVDGKFDMVVLSANAGVPDPDTLYNDYYTGQGNNYGKYSNPELDRILGQARSAMSVDQRKQLYAQAEKILVTDLPRVPVYEYLSSIAFRSNISNVRPSALGPMWDAAYWVKK